MVLQPTIDHYNKFWFKLKNNVDFFLINLIYYTRTTIIVTMPFPKSIKTEHKDLIHDVVYDFYGTRMATCSSDQCVKVWFM